MYHWLVLYHSKVIGLSGEIPFVTSPFPPSGNEGYIRNQDVPFQSVTFDVTNGVPYKTPHGCLPATLVSDSTLS